MGRKKAAPSEVKSRVTRRSTNSKRRHSPDPDSEWDEHDEAGPSTSKKKVPKSRGRKRKPEEDEDDEDDDEEEEDSPESSREPTPEPVKKKGKGQNLKKKKEEASSASPTPSRSPSPAPVETPKEKGKKGKAVSLKSKKKEPEPPKTVDKKEKNTPKRKKEETPEERKLRIRADRKARRIEEAKTRPKLTVEEKLAKLKKKKERRERRRQKEKDESVRQKYGQRKMKPEASKWNFGPISSINQRRRDEMMEFFPKANFSWEGGRPKVMNNFRKATVKYDMEVLNPFITCGVCDGYIVDATTIIDCMHTFCKSCLLAYFDADNNTCPTCGTFIHGSHPTHYVTYDRAVNELVNLFVPQLEQIELDSRKHFLRDCREALGIDTVAEDREKKERLERERVTGHNRCYEQEHPRFSHHRDDCQVTVNLLPGTPNLPLVSRPFVRCSEMTTMNTLKKFIALQIWDDQNRYSDLDMFCDGQLMGKDFSIRFVWMMKRRGQPKSEPLIVRYHMIRN